MKNLLAATIIPFAFLFALKAKRTDKNMKRSYIQLVYVIILCDEICVIYIGQHVHRFTSIRPEQLNPSTKPRSMSTNFVGT